METLFLQGAAKVRRLHIVGKNFFILRSFKLKFYVNIVQYVSRVSANFGTVTFYGMEATASWKTLLEWISARATEKMRFFS